MPRTLTVALGGSRSVVLPKPPVPHTALYAAIDSHLREQPHAGACGWRGRAAGALGVALSLALVPFAGADAATIMVDSSSAAVAVDASCTLPEAVANANDNAATHADCAAGTAGLDTIVFDGALASSTITLEDTLVVGDDLALDGSAAAPLAIDGAGQRILDAFAPLSIASMDLVYGRANTLGEFAGGAVYARDTLDVTDVGFFGNDAKYAGGAVLAVGDLTVTDSTFAYNRAGIENRYAQGGAIFSEAGAQVTGSTFAYNRASGEGGAIFARAGAAIDGSAFLYNQGTSGGAVFAGATQPFQPPQAKGVLQPTALQLSIGTSSFDGNRALAGSSTTGSFGGAVSFSPILSPGGYLEHSLSVVSSTFTGNQALPYTAVRQAAAAKGKYVSVGGGVAVVPVDLPALQKGVVAPDDVIATIDDSSFDANFAFLGGGAALFASSITVEDSSFDGNAAIVGGAAMLYSKYGDSAVDTSVTLARSAFTGNGAGIVGGLLAAATVLDASDLTVTGNIAGTPSAPPVAAKGFGPPVFTCGGGKYVGGAALFASGSLTMSGSNDVSGNCAGSAAGASIAVTTFGTATIAAGSVFNDNVADEDAGGVLLRVDDGATLLFEGSASGNRAGYSGGGLQVQAYGTGAVTISGATISGNSAAGVGGGLDIDREGGTIVVANSTLSGNSAGSGGGAFVRGEVPAALAAKGIAPTLVAFENVTVHGNQTVGAPAVVPALAGKGVATLHGGGIAVQAPADVAVRFGTITGNDSQGDGGGLWVEDGASVALANSIVAGNTAAGVGDDIAGAASADFTLVQDPAGATLVGTGNDLGSDPLLGPLQANGGPTETRLPLQGSPAIDTGDPAFAPPPATDQRGTGFPRVLNGVVDKGAVEVPPPLVVALQIAPTPFAEATSSTLTVSLDAATGADVMATVAFSGTAIAGTDFTPGDDDALTAGIQVLIEAGSTSGSITLDATSDGLDEVDEPFTATVTAASGALVDGVVAADAVIADIDGPPTVTLSLSQPTLVEEAGTTLVTATLSAASSQDVTVTLAYSGDATPGTDYSAPLQIVIPAGSLSGSLTITAIDDAANEGTETIVVDIAAVANGLESGVQQVVASIDDSADAAGAGPGVTPNPAPAVIPTLSEWMLMLLGLLLPATVVGRLRRREAPAQRRL